MAKSTKRIVITGVTRGLGRAMLDEFAARGHSVAGCGRSEAAVEKLRLQFTTPHRFATVDVADDMQVGQWARHVLTTMGPPDILINNAALTNVPAPLWEVPAAEFAALIDVNIKGTANMVRHFVPAMIEQGRGVIINFSSGWGRVSAPDGGCPLLRQQVGHRGTDSIPGAGTAQGHGRHSAESRNDRYIRVAQVVRRNCRRI